MREVEMPDGTVVPAFKVHELKLQEQNTELQQERTMRMQIESQLQEQAIELAELKETLESMAVELAAERAKPKKMGRPAGSKNKPKVAEKAEPKDFKKEAGK
jgi:hypothetical protein